MTDRTAKIVPAFEHTTADRTKPEAAVPSKYEAPGVVDLGTASGRILNRSNGNVKDYSNSWYTYTL
jgi:hypothetical protein